VKLSMILSSRNRAHVLREALSRLARLTSRHEWELVLVDNASTDNTAAVMGEFAASAGLSVKLVEERRAGWARAKNAGAQAATGEVLISIDDDCYPREDYLDELGAVFAHPEIAYMGGQIRLLDHGDAPNVIVEDLDEHVIPPRSFVPTGLIQGGNMAFRRVLYDDLGGFDEQFGAGARFSGADVEFVARASARGWTGEYVPQAVVFHNDVCKPGPGAELRMRWYDKGRGAYYAKFLLRRDTRLLYAKQWYWSQSFRRPSVFLRELSGAAHYTVRYLATRARRGTGGL
jgi:GT2 family glycosyltransferase